MTIDSIVEEALDRINEGRIMCKFCSCPIDEEFANAPCPSR